MGKLSLLYSVLKAFLLIKNRQHFETTELSLLYASSRDFNCILYIMFYKSSLPQKNWIHWRRSRAGRRLLNFMHIHVVCNESNWTRWVQLLCFLCFDLTLLRHKKCIEVAFLQSSTKSTQVEPFVLLNRKDSRQAALCWVIIMTTANSRQLGYFSIAS